MIVEQILARSAGIFSRIYNHPFNQQLCQGTLAQEKFIAFLRQDAKYLRTFSIALRQLSHRFDDRRLADQFKWFSKEMIQSERNLQSKYLYDPHNIFFSNKSHIIPKIPVIAHYTTYQLNMVRTAPIEEAISSLASCYLIYQKLLELVLLEKF